MKRLFNYLLILFVLGFVIISCNDDDDKPQGEFSSGVLVVNEGNFGDSDGSIGHYDPSSGEVKQDIYGQKNNGVATGDVVQSLTVDGDYAYIVINNDDEVKVANAHTLAAEYTLTGVTLPRYFATYNGKGYLTEWVSFNDAGAVAVIDLQNRKVEATITTDYGAENIIVSNNMLFVSNNWSNTVSVINPAENKVIATIDVASSPGEFQIDSDGKLWVICSGDWNANNAALYKINPSTNVVESSLALGSASARLAINKSKNQLYYLSNNGVYKVSTQSPSKPANAFITNASIVSAYGIGVDPKTDIIYIGDSKAFNANGSVFLYNADGTSIDSFAAGMGPNGFVFR